MVTNKKVIKRDGSIVEFDKTKIENAILKAMKYGSGVINEEVAHKIAKEIEGDVVSRSTISISQIETIVYHKLIENKHEHTAKAYEGYRAIQQFKRETNTTDDSIFGLLDGTNVDTIDENSNKKGYLASTQRDLIAGEVSKDIVRRKKLPPHIVQAHDEGVIHFHDADYYIQSIFNCCLINLEDMLNNGTVINDKLVESPTSFSTACTVTTQIMAQIASAQYGGQSIAMKHLAPFLTRTKDKYTQMFKDLPNHEEIVKRLTQKELKDGVQTIRYQLSTLQTTNGQSPFATIYLEIDEDYGYVEEQALIVEEMLNQRIEGMKNYKGQNIAEAFPKLVYLLDEHNCLEGGKYDYLTKLASKCTAKRMVPDYQSAKHMRKNYEGGCFPPMGCRSHLSPWKDEQGNHKWYGRFNQGVVSLNLPQIGIIANKDMDKFWQLLDNRLELCYEALMCRHNALKGTLSDVSPIHWQHGAIARLKQGETIDKLLVGGYSTISLGFVGLHETTMAMLDKSITSTEGEAFALEIVQHMKNKCEQWKEETSIAFSLYSTPAENLIYRFNKIDKAKYGIIEGVTDKMYYTNSYHVHVCEEIDAFDKLAFEAPFHSISTGGCISYIEVPNLVNNIEAIESIVNFIYHNVQYAEINTRPDLCYVCGFEGEIKTDANLEWVCPNCGNRDKKEMHVLRRTCGYLGSAFWNKGRTAEISERVLHLQ